MITATYIDHMGNDLSVVNAARVSFGKKSEAFLEGDARLIKYLASHGHISPFGHCFASFHVKAPVFVARQLVKHKFLRWNEISRRYVDDEPEFYTPEVWRGRAKDAKQGSSGEVVTHVDQGCGHSGCCPPDGSLAVPVNDCVEDLNEAALVTYSQLLEAGVAPEQARMILPQSTMTEWIWSGSLDAFADMARLRCATDTQAESQKVAWDIYFCMEELFPVSWTALMEDAY